MTPDNVDPTWLNKAHDNASIQAYYDQWAQKYDADLADWNYTAPMVSAELLNHQISSHNQILDVGCGTGLVGMALRQLGFSEISGTDFSADSLAQAKKRDVYQDLTQFDLSQLPLPYDSDQFNGLACVGVLTYIKQFRELFIEFCRVIRPNGAAVFTHRADLVENQGFIGLVEQLSADGYWDVISISEPKPYLPNLETLQTPVVYFVCQVR